MFLDSFLPYRLTRVADRLSDQVMPVYRERYAMTRPEWRVLVNLAERPSSTARELSLTMPMHKTKVSRALATLEKRGWIARKVDTHDHRLAHVFLTAKGRAAYDSLVPLARDAAESVLARLSSAERAQVEEAMRVLERAVFADLPGL